MNEVITKNACELFVMEMKDLGKTPREIISLLVDEIVTQEAPRYEFLLDKELEPATREFLEYNKRYAVIKCFLSGTIDEMRSWLQKPKFKFFGEGMPELGTSIEEHLDDWLDVARRESTIIGK